MALRWLVNESMLVRLGHPCRIDTMWLFLYAWVYHWYMLRSRYDLIISSSCRWRTIKSITKPVKFQIHSKHPFYHSMQRNWHQVLPPVQLHHDKRIHFGKDISKCFWWGFPSLDLEIATQKGMGRKPFPKPRFHPCPCWQDSKSFSMKVAIPCGNWSFTGQLRSFKRLPWLHGVLNRKINKTPPRPADSFQDSDQS